LHTISNNPEKCKEYAMSNIVIKGKGEIFATLIQVLNERTSKVKTKNVDKENKQKKETSLKQKQTFS
jgi:hypothetical protein